MADVLTCDVWSPCSDTPVETGLLHIDSSSQESCPVWDYEFWQFCLPFHHGICRCLELSVLPRFCEPGVHEVLKLFWIVFTVQELFRNFRESDKRRVERIDPVGYFLTVLRALSHRSPFSVPEHPALFLEASGK